MLMRIGGQSCVGKTAFADKFKRLSDDLGKPASIMHLDSYVIERDKRHGIYMFDPRIYNWDACLSDILDVLAGNDKVLKHYDHMTGKYADEYEVKHSDILIVEGVPALDKHISDLNKSYKILLTADPHKLTFYQVFENTIKRGYSAYDSIEMARAEHENYKRFVEPFMDRADYVFWRK
jgi:uridine kinase